MENYEDTLNMQEVTEANEPKNNTEGSEMSLVDWLWRLCIPIIPCIGIIIYIVLLFMWAFGKKKTERMRTWAKAALIATAIQLVFLGVIFLVVQLNVDLLGLMKAFLKHV